MKKFLIETKSHLISCDYNALKGQIDRLKCSKTKYRVIEL